MGGSSQTPPTTSTTTVLSPQQQELMNLALPGVREFAASTPQRYQGDTVAPFDPAQVQGQQMALDAASGAQTGLAKSGTDASNYWLSPGAIDVGNDPAVQNAVTASTRPITQQLTESILPALRSGATGNGTYGSSRQGIAEGLASGRASQAVGDTASKLVETARESNVRAQLQALGLLPQTIQAQTAPATTTSAVGDVRQGQTQAEIGSDVSNFNFDQYAPFLQSKEILALLTGIPGATTVSTGSVPPAPSHLTQALAGAGTGAAVGSAFGPIGTGVGAAGGALLPFLLS